MKSALALALPALRAGGGRGAGSTPSAITLLQIMGSAALDATGDYGDATQRIGVNGEGWVGRITVPYQLGQTFDPTKIGLTVRDPGYDSSGETIITRNITGGAILRRQYAAQAERQQKSDGEILTVYFSLSDEIYHGSTIVDATAAGGYYGVSKAGAIIKIINNSTRAYPKPLWAWLNLQHERATGSSFSVEGVAYHRHARNGRQVARVEFIAKDAQSTPNFAPKQTASSTSLSTFQTKGQIVEAYRGAPATEPLTQGDLCEVNAKVYPWIGDTSAVLDLELDGLPWPTASPQTPLRFLNDKTGDYGGAHVAVKAGAASGAVQSTYALALATPFPNISTALAALPSWNQSNKGHNDHSGGTIWLMEGSPGAGANHSTANSGVAADINTIPAGHCWTDIRVDPAATGRVKMTMAAARLTADLLRWSVDIDHTAGNGLQGPASASWLRSAYENMVLNLASTTATVAVSYRNALTYVRNVDQINVGGLSQCCFGRQGGAGYRMQYPLMLGVSMADTTTGMQVLPFAVIGCIFQRSTMVENNYAILPIHDSMDGAVVANNMFVSARGSSTWGHMQGIVRGFAFVQNVVERAVVASAPALQIGADGQVRPLDNIVIQHNTIPGTDATGRANIAYADTDGAAGVIKRVSLRSNLFHEYNCKTDTFTGSPSGTVTSRGRVGNWQNRYGVGFEGNVIVNGDSASNAAAPDEDGSNWLGEFCPPGSIFKAGATSVKFADNRAGVVGVGGGTYTLIGALNAAFDQVPAGRAALSFDLAGHRRLNDGAGAAGAYERSSG